MGSTNIDLNLSRDGTNVQKFYANRSALISQEKQHRSDHAFRQSLSPSAKQASAIVSRIRDEERRSIWTTKESQHELFPGMMFNVAKEHMESTRLWQIVRKMPKGTLLHAHLGAMVDLDWVFNEALATPGMCISSPVPLHDEHSRQNTIVTFAYSKSVASSSASIWSPDYAPTTLIPIKEAAESFPHGGREGFVSWMKDICSITQSESLQHHLGVDDVWKKLQAAFIILCPIIYYEPIMRAFLQKLFITLLEDGVRGVEVRAVLITHFVLEGQESPSERGSIDLARVISDEIEKFASSLDGKDFWGARVIWTSMRGQDTQNIIKDMKQCIQVKKLFPRLISGYDLVGQEDLGRTLHDLTPELLWFQEACAAEGANIPFFFHAGECLGDGDETDQNLFDAVLFGTRRIGHAFSLYKHPVLIDMVKKQKILVESCPISNEVLRYTASIMSHPLPALLSRGVAASLCNDDPALLGQGTSGMTHDFWQALQGWENLGLEGLGSLAENSVRWAAFEDQTEHEWLRDIQSGVTGTGTKAKRMQQWSSEWEGFCKWIVAEFDEKD